MRTYEATVTREGRWWMVSIPELDGLTQARRLGEAPRMAAEWIATMTDVEVDQVKVVLTSIVVDGRDMLTRRESIQELRAQVEALQERLSELTRATARDLVEHEVPVRDVGEVLEVSPQRVSQLVHHD